MIEVANKDSYDLRLRSVG